MTGAVLSTELGAAADDRRTQAQALRDELAAPEGAVGDSMSVAVWTVVSRVSGVVRGVTVASVLGATYFANTYQFTNSLPNLVFYGFLAGSMASSLLVPALVRHLDAGDAASARRVAGGVFGTVIALMLLVVPVAVLVAPVALRLAGSAGGADAAGQARAAGLLVAMLMPQVPLYGVVGTATAVMNAQRRFALAAAAPALENLGTIAVLAAVAVLYPDARSLQDAPLGLLLLLGLGTTGAVGLHAAAQWWGARRTGVTLLPSRGWRDPEVRAVLRQAVPALGQAGLGALQLLVLLALADRIAGGVVAFQLAMNFYFLPVALAATPVALSLTPRLSRMLGPADAEVFRDTYLRGLVFALFLAVPAAAAYLALARPLADALSFGAFAQGSGAALVAACLSGLGVGVAAETVFLVSTYACYARGDTRTPMRAMLVATAVTLAVGAAATRATGTASLTLLGAALSAGGVCGSVVLVAAMLRASAPGGQRIVLPLLRTLCCAALMVLPARAVAGRVAALGLPVPAVSAMIAAAVAGAATYFAAQGVLRAPELAWVGGSFAGKVAGKVAGTPGGGRGGNFGSMLPRPAGLLRDAGLLLVCAGIGGLAAIDLRFGALAAAGLGFAAVIWLRPQLSAYLLIGFTPLTAGIDRGTVLPALRPNEGLLFGLAAILAVRAVVLARRGDLGRLRLSAVEWAIVGFATFSSFVPLAVMVVRNREVTGDDLSYVIVVWKLVLLYAIVRCTVTTVRQVMTCLAVSMAAGAVVSVVAVLQSLGLFGVPRLLATFYAPFGIDSALAIGRGSSTLSLPAAVADLAILNLILSLSLLMRRIGPRPLLAGSAVLSVFGVVGAAEFSTFLGMVVALLAFVLVTGHRRLLLQALPVGAVGWIALEPVIAGRLSGFQSASGIPVSWYGRWRNLQTYFWPELKVDWNWALGVRLSARVPASSQEFGWIWIESGYTWLLWGGGLPFLASFVVLVVVTMRAARRLVVTAPGPVAAAATAVFCCMAADVFLMLLDPHITYRGAADALFGLFALARPMAQAPGGQLSNPASTKEEPA